jgi:hypothetical protein
MYVISNSHFTLIKLYRQLYRHSNVDIDTFFIFSFLSYDSKNVFYCICTKLP